MIWYVDFYELFVLWVGRSGVWVHLLLPTPRTPAVGGGGEGNNYAFRGRGRGEEGRHKFTRARFAGCIFWRNIILALNTVLLRMPCGQPPFLNNR
jgi:hypothetical protein